MKALKILYLYYWVIFLTPIIYFARTFYGERLENEIYLKQTGNFLKRCVAIPGFIVIPILLFICLGLFLWTKKIKEKIYTTNNLTSNDYLDLTVITVFIFFFVFLDFGMVRLLINLTAE